MHIAVWFYQIFAQVIRVRLACTSSFLIPPNLWTSIIQQVEPRKSQTQTALYLLCVAHGDMRYDIKTYSAVTAEYPPAKAARPPPPARPAPPSPAPPRPPRPRSPRASPPADSTADFLNLASGAAPAAEPTRPEKKLKNEDSFDFFGMMENKTDDGFGDFLSGNKAEKAQVGFQVCFLRKFFILYGIYFAYARLYFLSLSLNI